MKYSRPKIYVNGRQLLVSRFTMERHLGRKLKTEELVHHINENPLDNRIENLQIVTRSEHKRIHATIGMATRLKKVWHLSLEDVFQHYQTKTADEIAKIYGCSGRTVLRTLKKHPKLNEDQRKKTGTRYIIRRKAG